uniref:tRNA-dihydrouridine(47) synthase [NAD(P)(+)] n=1 Tax=Taeniopygia guttata TaxID=59729 RepID=H0YRY5_TAEGU
MAAAAAPGVAPVRARFLTSKEQFHAYLRAGGKEEEEEKEEKEEEEQVSEPPAKRVKAEEPGQDGESRGDAGEEEEEEERPEKKRARGQNKSRPCMKPKSYEQSRLCPSVTQGCGGQCRFGPRCRFLHDVSEYLAAKPADLGGRCVLFDTFGRCPYGVTCRFGRAHLGEGHQNLLNAALAQQWEGKLLVRNGLSKDLQQQLRKRRFSFQKAEEFLRGLRAGKGGKASGGSAEVAECSAPQEGLGDSPVLQEQGEDPKPETLQSSQGAEGALRPEVLQSSQGAEGDPKAEVLNSSQKAEGAPRPEVLNSSQKAEGDPKPEALQNSQKAEGALNPEVLNSSQGAEGALRPEVLQSSQGAEGAPSIPTLGPLTDEDVTKLRPCEKKKLEIQGKLYLAPLTTCGNLPFRRICKRFGADVTCGEMAVCTNLLQGQSSEWALLKRHHTEDIFGVQLEGAFPDTMTKCAELLNRTIDVDFVDINVGCPIDLVYKKGGGCALMTRSNKFEQIVRGMNSVLDVPVTVKIRTGVQEKVNVAHKLIPRIREWGASMVTLHGRSREQRYTRSADWHYIAECARLASPMPLFGNGDILSYEDANRAMQMGVSGIMIARGALIKPWLFTEIKEQRHWDISSSERFEILKDFTNYGLEHWGSDTQGVEKTRKFLLEWLSFLCRYIPVGLLEHLPQKINERPPYYLGRDYLETLMASQNVDDWIKISELLLGPVPPSFTFLPKHKANSYR